MHFLFLAGILQIEKYAKATTYNQRREHDANKHFSFAAAFHARQAREQNFAQKIKKHLRPFRVHRLIVPSSRL
jgi:hypothetical protein